MTEKLLALMAECEGEPIRISANSFQQESRHARSPGRGRNSMAQIIVIDREGVEHQVEGAPGVKIMEILRDLAFGVAAICGGMCSCATCHVYIDKSWKDRLSPRDLDESYLLQELF